MKRSHLILVSSLLVFALFAIGGFLFARARVVLLPEQIREALYRNDILFNYADVESSQFGLGFTLTEVSISGKYLPYTVTLDGLNTSVGLSPSIPPITLTISLNKPTVSKNSSAVPQLASPATSQPPPSKLVSIALGFLRTQLHIVDGNFSAVGIGKVDGSIMLKNIALSAAGLGRATTRYYLSASQFISTPWLPPIVLKGTTSLGDDHLEMDDNLLLVGPLILELKGNYSLKDATWSTDLKVPPTTIDPNSSIFDFEKMDSVRSLSGKIDIQIRAEGKGGDFGSAKTSGHINLEKLQLGLNHEVVSGDLTADVTLSLIKEERLKSLKGKIKLNLTDAEIGLEKRFRKAKGVPLTLSLSATGRDNVIYLEKSEFNLHNLVAKIKGAIGIVPTEPSNLMLEIPPTDLAGWEKFFPEYSHIKTKGTLSTTATYIGPLNDWKQAKINTTLKAKRVKFPILSEWIPNKMLRIRGIGEIDTNTLIIYDRGKLRIIGTKTTIDLSHSQVDYGDKFSKKAKIPLLINVDIKSSATSAKIHRGSITLGKIRTTFSGSVDNFQRPIAQIAFKSNTFNIKDVLSFSPKPPLEGVTKLGGSIQLSGKLHGTKLTGVLNTKRIALKYDLPPPMKPVVIRNLTGAISFTSDSVSSKRLSIRFPRSDGSLTFNVESFSKPTLSVSVCLSVCPV